jgi:hypothetical protein
MLDPERVCPENMWIRNTFAPVNKKHKIITNHLIRKLLHEVNIEGLEAVPVRGDEVEAAVDTVVHNVLPVQAALVTQISASEENSKI